MAITAPDISQTAGIPYQWTEEFLPTPEGWVIGDDVKVLVVDHPVAPNQNLAALTPVAFNANNQIVVAAPGTPAIGFTVIAVVTGASGAVKGTPVYRGGNFNADLAKWPAAYNTVALKLDACNGAPTPTQIKLQFRKGLSVPAP